LNKTLKIIALAVGGLVALIALLFAALTLLFDPNDYRDDIIQAVKTATGRELKIEGRLGWSLIPRLGITTERVELGNAPGFGRDPFARIDAAGVSVEWLPLLTGRVSVNTIYLDGLNVNLANNAAGQSNWSDLVTPRETRTEPAGKPAGQASLAAFAAQRLDIRRTTLTWQDQATGARYAARDLALQAGPLALDQPMGIELSFELEYGEPVRRVPVKLQTQLVYAADRLALERLALGVNGSHLTGSAEVVNLANPAVRFDMALDQFDLDKYLPGASPPATAGTGKDSKTAAAGPAELPLPLLRTLDVQGKFAIGKLKAIGLRTEDIRVQLAARNGVIQFGPNSAKLYGGTYESRTTLDVRSATPKIKLEETLNSIQLGPFLKDAGVFDKFSGTAEIRLALTAQGAEANALKRTLNGKVAVAARDGKIEGVNFEKLIAEAKQLADQLRGKQASAAPAATDETAFKSLRATFKLTNGVAVTDDFTLDGPTVRAKGGGNADLVKETLDARLKVTVAEAAGRKGSTVPVTVSGPFAKPSFGVDVGEALKDEAGRKLEKKLEQKLEKYFQKR
jgi:AsmA protein